jgi:hypothetical protein
VVRLVGILGDDPGRAKDRGAHSRLRGIPTCRLVISDGRTGKAGTA